MSSEIRNSIINLERDYAAHKEKFVKWKEENAALSGHASYNSYVDQFLSWEKNVLEQLEEQKRQLKVEMATQPVITEAPKPRPTTSLPAQIPMIDMDTQVNEMLQKVTPAEFMMAVFSMAQTDANFLPKVFEVVHRESKGTGFFNPIMPSSLQKMPLTSNLPHLHHHHHHSNNYQHRHLAPSTSYYPNYSAPPPTITTSTATVGYNNVGPGSLLSGSTSSTSYYRAPVPLLGYDPRLPPPRLYAQPQPQIYGGGPIPEGWTVQPAIIKGHRMPSPKHRAGANIPLPFKDFQMGGEKSLLD